MEIVEEIEVGGVIGKVTGEDQMKVEIKWNSVGFEGRK